MDELYREANAENEALYEKFNEELGRVMKGMKDGKGVEEMRKRIEALEKDNSRIERERRRLAREVAGLRAVLKD